MKLEFIDLESGDARKVSTIMPQAVNTNINLINAEVSNDMLNLSFEFTALYTPDGSYIRMHGKAKFSGKEVKKAYEEWGKTQTITGETGEYILNSINYTSTVNSVFLARVFGLTPPVTLPVLKFELQKKK